MNDTYIPQEDNKKTRTNDVKKYHSDRTLWWTHYIAKKKKKTALKREGKIKQNKN